MHDVNVRHGKGASRHQSDVQPLLLFQPGASQDAAVHIKGERQCAFAFTFPHCSLFLLALLIYHSANPESSTTKHFPHYKAGAVWTLEF